MPSPFASWNTAAKAKKHIPKNKHAETVRLLYNGHHWRDGRGWKGPIPQDADPAMYAWFMGEVARSFTSMNTIKEVVDRLAAGAVGKEPTWSWVPRRAMAQEEEPTAPEQALIDEVTAATTDWYNERLVHELLENVVAAAIHSEAAVVRFYVPVGFLTAETVEVEGEDSRIEYVFSGTTLAEALEAVWIESPQPDPDEKKATEYNSWVHTDNRTKRKVGIYVYSEEEEGANSRERVELCYVEPDTGKTVIRILGGREDIQEEQYDLGGRLTMYMVTQRRFVTKQMLEIQDSINLGLTMLPRGMTLAGFVEMTFLGAQAPGTWDYDADNKPIPGTFKQGTYPRGAGTVNFVQGVAYEEVDPQAGKLVTKITTPSVHVREPSSLSPVIEGTDALYTRQLREADQAHFLLADQAEASGVSKQESRAEYMRAVRKLIRGVNALGRWLVETPVAVAEDLLGTPDDKKWTKLLRCDFNCRPDFGPISPDEIRVEMEAGDKQYKPKSAVQSAIGIDDPGAANAEIAAQPDALLDVRKRQGEVAASWTGAGAPLEVAAWMAGVRPADVEGLDTDIPKLQKVLYGDENTPTKVPEEDPDNPKPDIGG